MTRWIFGINDQLFTKRQILDFSKLKKFADENFKFDENDGKFSEWVEDAVGEKGEIARYELFSFSRSFHKTCTVVSCLYWGLTPL